MAEEKKGGTIYQQLNQFLNLGGFDVQTAQPTISASTPAKESKIIIKGNSPEEIHRKGLELEQKRELQNKFFRTTDRGFQKALQYEAARLPAYIDFEGMEYYPIISSALDLFMEETTTIGLNGKMLNIYSNKERIKSLLEEFFYDIVNVNVNLPFWTRNLPVKYDSIIPLLNGESITIKELSERMKKNPNEEIWTYAIQDETRRILPGKIIWCDLTRKNSDILKITFDDGTYIETTPDHEYMLRNGSYLRADELKEGVSLMPFYTLTSNEANFISGYEKVYNPSSNHHVFTHRLVAQECVVNLDEENGSEEIFVTYHIDFNKKNNHPLNLLRLTSAEHSNYHMMLGERGKTILQRKDVKENRMLGIDKYLRSEKRKKRLSKEMLGIYPEYFNDYNNSPLHEEHNIICKNKMIELWSDEEYRNMVKNKMQLKIDDNCLNYIINIFETSNNYISAKKLGERLVCDDEFMKLFKNANKLIRKNLTKSLSSTTLLKLIFRKTHETYCDFALKCNPKFINESNFKGASVISKVRVDENCVLNHKVLSIERISEKYDVYCMEVVGKNNEQDRHNFAVCGKNENGEYTRNGVFLSNCKYGDNFVVTYGERKKGITHVKQLVNYEIERFERIQNGKPLVKFKERMTGDEFNVFEIAHFRLLGDDKFLPYGSCLLSDSYIKTTNGIKEIKNILKDDVVIGFDIKTQKKIESKVLDVVCNGEKQTYKISTQHNYLKATDNHKLPFYDYSDDLFKEKFVSELKIGDGLIINNYDDYNEQTEINKAVEIKVHRGRIYDDFVDDLKYIPNYVDEDFAKLFGFLVGDGGVNAKRPYMVYFAYGMHDTINKKYINLLEKFSNKEIYLRKNKNYSNGIASAVVNSKSLTTILKNMEFAGDARTKRIPKWLFSTSTDIRKAFLEGIQDADGSVNIDKWNCKRFTIEMSNYGLVNDIKLLAQSLGYKTGSINKRKKRENVIINGVKVKNIADSYTLYYYESKNEQIIVSDIKNRLTNEFIIEKIKSIELDEIGFVYDIHVDNKNHNFFANNILVHNSVLNKVRRVFRQLCLDSNTKIWTPDGYTLIKNINVGDTVFSYDHRDKTVVKAIVKNVMKTGIKERFKIKTNHREMILTNDHPLLIKNILNEYSYNNIDNILNEKLILPTIIDGNDSFKIKLDDNDYYFKLNESGKLKTKNIEGVGIINKLKELNCKTSIKNLHSFLRDGIRSIKYSDYIKLMNVFNLTIDDVDLFYFNSRIKPIVNKNLEFDVNNDFMQLFGFMLGDGWTSNIHHTVGFALGIYDDENQYYIDLCKNIGNFKCAITSESDSRGGQVNFYSRELYNIFIKLGFKTGAFNKRIPNWVYSLSYNNKIKFINGMIDADGCDSNNLYSSSNYDLITDLKVLCQTCNIKVGKIYVNKASCVEIKGVKCNRRESYSLYVKIKEQVNEISERILSIENVGVGEVWDIEVENDLHNFIADGIVVHNCMAEDAMLTYRIIRAGEKKVFKIDVGNIDEDDIEEYIYKVATKFKKTAQVQPNDGQIDYRFNILGNDEDYFLPVRNANTQTGIETLPGASNLSDIQDIEYLRDNLFVGLGIPKPFLSFQDAAGAGKNMAQYDIRFAKKINRIQQAMIQELNKMAMVHLYLLGYSAEDLSEFTLTLTNPSTQQELLKSELLREKAQTYTELTRGEGGIAAMSHTGAKRLLFNMSDREIVDDLKQQKMEKVVMQELQDSPVTIKKTGLFTDIDSRFGEVEGTLIGAAPSGGTEQGGMPPMGGAPAGMPPEGGMPPAGGGGMPPAGGGGMPPMGGAPAGGGGELPPMVEIGKGLKKSVLTEEEYDSHVEKLVYGSSTEPVRKKEVRSKKILKENDAINDNLNKDAQTMINEIDMLLENSKVIDIEKKFNESEDIDFESIENIDLVK